MPLWQQSEQKILISCPKRYSHTEEKSLWRNLHFQGWHGKDIFRIPSEIPLVYMFPIQMLDNLLFISTHMSRTSLYLNFANETEKAFEFYRSIFGGEFVG